MITAQDVAVLDRNAEALGVPPRVLMESSGNAVAATVTEVAPDDSRILILGGRGNNGGDGFVAARYLDNFTVRVGLLGRPEAIRTEEARANWETLTNSAIETESIPDPTAFEFNDPDVIVDALLGTGVTGALRNPERRITSRINDQDATVVAVDTPSGIDVDTGDAEGIAVDADHVVTFHDMKPGLTDHPNVDVADIGIPDAASRFVGPGDCLRLSRNPDGHKGDFGHVLVVGGGPYTGAPALSGQAALRGGADLVTVATPATAADAVQSYSENLIVKSLEGSHLHPDHVNGLLSLAREADVLLLGPGLGDADETQTAVSQLLTQYEGVGVVDADALEVVPEVSTRATLICTPHQGELSAMGGPTEEEWEARAAKVQAYATELGVTFLVKGAYDIISDGDATRVNRTGNPGMTVGGTGDVLAGVASAFAATLEPRHAAALAAYANGRAGDIVVDSHGFGLVATDLIDSIPQAVWSDRNVQS